MYITLVNHFLYLKGFGSSFCENKIGIIARKGRQILAVVTQTDRFNGKQHNNL